MDAAASVSTSTTEPKTRKPPKNLERLVGAWKRAYRIAKKAEAVVDAARDAVVELLVTAGVPVGESIETAHGKITLQARTTTDWQGLARKFIAADVIEKHASAFTSMSKPFARAPHGWGSEK